MKTTFGRTFSTMVIVLLLALTVVGTTFQALVKDYITDNPIAELQQNSSAIADLASAYYSESSSLNRDFMVNLDVAAKVTDSDAVICGADGRVLLCSDALNGCDHQDLRVSRDYIEKVVENGGDVATGTIKDLYEESRYVVSSPITDVITGDNLGIVIVSKPIVETDTILSKISNIFTVVSLLVVGIAFIVMSIFARRQSDPLKQMANTARAFGHGDLEARVRLTDDYPEEFDLFLPQSLVVGEGVAKPSITFTVDVKWTTTDTVTMTLELPTKDSAGNDMVWRAGRKYIYLITVQPDRFDVEVRTTEWDEVAGSVGDIVFQ